MGLRRVGHEADVAPSRTDHWLHAQLFDAMGQQPHASRSATEPDIAEGIKAFYKSAAISAHSFARCVAFAVGQPDDMDVNEILFRPTLQAY